MKNSPNTRQKASKIEVKTNKLVFIVFILQISIGMFSSIYQTWWNVDNKDETDFYLGWSISNDSWDNSTILIFIIAFGSWWLSLGDFVPISLLVTLEFIKFFQSVFMIWDANLFDETKNISSRVQSSCLIEELGQVEYIFSDKTGTLTQNIMEFRKMGIGNFTYGISNPKEHFNTDLSADISNLKEPSMEEVKSRNSSEQDKVDYSALGKADQTSEITNVRFFDPDFFKHAEDIHHENYDRIHEFLIHLALCHTVVFDKHEVDGKEILLFNASSPDELALVNAARHFGYYFGDRDEQNKIVVQLEDGSFVKYNLLNVIEFDSTRKRMTVIVKTPDGAIKVLCKGADSIMYERLKSKEFVEETKVNLENFANEGLRTLLMAQKYITEEEYAEWVEKYNEAALSLNNREEKMNAVADEIEYKFDLIGVTAVEDKLQDDVANTISILK